MKRLLLCAVLVVGMTGPAGASFIDGNKLLARCQNKTDTYDQAYCLGYIIGVADVLEGKGTVQGFRACFPDNIVQGQAFDTVIAWLKANPSVRHFSANELVAVALSKAFPC